MGWQVKTAKNGELTLLLNGVQLYSQYHPIENAQKFIRSEYDEAAPGYFLFGLGLGYHLNELLLLAKNKPVFVLYFSEEEKALYDQYSIGSNVGNISWVNKLTSTGIPNNYQIIIPYAWTKALGDEHPLIASLHDIKINQISYRRFAPIMQKNFQSNIELQDKLFSKFSPSGNRKLAYLVSAGPSLNETISWLKEKSAFVLCVGSALPVLLAAEIIPDAVIIADAQVSIEKQVRDLYKGPLFYLSTANHGAVQKHSGERYLIPQTGYPLAEQFAEKKGSPTLLTGGSVATVALKLLEFWNYQNVVLFGQDFGFNGIETHAENSTSKIIYSHVEKSPKILANSGREIFTKSNLLTYLRWFERELKDMSIKVYTTAWDGARINGVIYLNNKDFENL